MPELNKKQSSNQTLIDYEKNTHIGLAFWMFIWIISSRKSELKTGSDISDKIQKDA